MSKTVVEKKKKKTKTSVINRRTARNTVKATKKGGEKVTYKNVTEAREAGVDLPTAAQRVSRAAKPRTKAKSEDEE